MNTKQIKRFKEPLSYCFFESSWQEFMNYPNHILNNNLKKINNYRGIMESHRLVLPEHLNHFGYLFGLDSTVALCTG